MASTTAKPPSSKNSTGDYVFGMNTVYPMKMTGAGIIITTAVLVFLVCLIIILKIFHLTYTPGGETARRRRKKSADSGVPWLKRMSMKMTRRKTSPKDADNEATDRTGSMTLSEKEAESRPDTPTVTANTKNNKRMSVQSNWSVVSHVGKLAFGKKHNKGSKKDKSERRATIKEKHERKGSKKDKDKGDDKDSDKGEGGKKESMKEKRRESKKDKSERKLSKKKSNKDRMSLSKHLSTLPGEVPPIIERKMSIP